MGQGHVVDHQIDSVGQEITNLDIAYGSLNGNEQIFGSQEKKLKKDMADMLEYVKMLTNQLMELRKRTRAAQ